MDDRPALAPPHDRPVPNVGRVAEMILNTMIVKIDEPPLGSGSSIVYNDDDTPVYQVLVILGPANIALAEPHVAAIKKLSAPATDVFDESEPL